MIVVKLGNLRLTNSFEELDVLGANVKQSWDHMYMKLDSMQVLRSVHWAALITTSLSV